MATVRFYGDLQRYGRQFKLDVLTAGEALHALFLQIPGLRQHVQNDFYRVRIAGNDICEDDLQFGMTSILKSDDVIHIIPAAIGAGGVFQAIAGAVLMRKVFKVLKKQVDYAEYGGAPLIGINGCAIIGHGKSNSKAVKNAIFQAIRYVNTGVNEHIEKRLEELKK